MSGLTWPLANIIREKSTSWIKDFDHQCIHRRLHSALGYVTPYDCMLGLNRVIHAKRDHKLEEAVPDEKSTGVPPNKLPDGLMHGTLNAHAWMLGQRTGRAPSTVIGRRVPM